MEQLFLSVFHKGMASGYLILAVLIARIVLKRAPKNMVCLLWFVVGLQMLCPFYIQTVFSVLPDQAGTTAYQQYRDTRVAQGKAMPASVNPKTDTWMTETDTGMSKTDTGMSEMAKTVEEFENPIQKFIPAAVRIWVAGLVIMAANLAFSWHCMKKSVETAVPAELEGIRFYQCDQISSPFLFGLAVPKIYVPFSVSGQELSFVLKHESAHKSRRDHLAKFAGYLLLAVYWFQPLAWAAYLMFCRDIELACDERVIRESGEDCKKAYSQTLLSCSISHRAAVAGPLAFGEIGVKKRVKNILNYKKPGLWMSLSAAIVCVLVTVCFATMPVAGRQAQTEVQKSVVEWAQAYCGRDAKTIYTMLDDAGRKELTDAGMLEGKHSFGWSSPWPWDTGVIDGQDNYRILSADETSAELLYYAWTSDPHVTVWRQQITYQYSKEDGILVHEVSGETLDDIHTAEQFYTAYPNGEIDHTRMDYANGNGVGEALNDHSLTDSSGVLNHPDTAAVFLLNIQNDPSAVKVDVSDRDGDTIVTFTFLEDGSSASVKMIRLLDGKGIWLPQTDVALNI